ncbi:MAG TPA: response regulator transcription factor, partial [Puia sp.]|nr:response regulator transcription factor [Puia sp.]
MRGNHLMRILIVEGETEVSRAIQANLTRENFVCDIAASAREAKEFIAAFVYDCIIVDGDLPEGRATQLLAVLKASRRSEGILMISNPDSLNARKKALNAGADDYLDKPFESSDLTARVCALAHRKQFKGKPTLAHNELAV